MNLGCRHSPSSMYGILLFHVIVIVFTAVFFQEAACIERFHGKNRVNILDLENRIKLYIYSKATYYYSTWLCVFNSGTAKNKPTVLFQHHHFLC